jgi:hypothetical protein
MAFGSIILVVILGSQNKETLTRSNLLILMSENVTAPFYYFHGANDEGAGFVQG